MLGIHPPARARPIQNIFLLLAGLLAFSSVAGAQNVPAAPPVPTPPAAAGVGGKLASCAGTIGSLLSKGKQQCCGSPLGQLLNGAVKPLSMATGGVIPTPCPDPHEPSQKPSGGGGPGGGAGGPPGPQQAAEAIKQDQAQAKARAAAVRYLATVPCHYYPEAESGLITALRTDRSECVRWEAAHALAQGCCCTKRTIEALKITVSGSHKDGNPAEISARVRSEALNALQHCLATCGDSLPTPRRPEAPAPAPEPIPTPLPSPQRPETPSGSSTPGPATAGVQQANYYAEVERRPARELLAEARQLLASAQLARVPPVESGRGKSLLELWRRSDKPATRPSNDISSSSLASHQDPSWGGQVETARRPTLAAPQSPALRDSPSITANLPLPSVLKRTGPYPRTSAGPLRLLPPTGASSQAISAPTAARDQQPDQRSAQPRADSIPIGTLQPVDQWMYPSYAPPSRAARLPDSLRSPASRTWLR